MTVCRRLLAAGLRTFAPLAVFLTAACGLIYLAAQQVLRASANDAPTQLAEDAVASLKAGQMPEALKTGAKVDMERSLSPFLIYLDEKGQVVAATAELNGKTPVPPAGVLGAAREHGVDRITWSPARGARSATCVIAFDAAKPGFVVAGKSLRETQAHIGMIGNLIFMGWAVSMAALFVAVAGGALLAERIEVSKIRPATA